MTAQELRDAAALMRARAEANLITPSPWMTSHLSRLSLVVAAAAAVLVTVPAADAVPSCSVAAHRGGTAGTENGTPAFAAALARGEIVEADVSPTLDGQLVVMHDATLDRTSTGTGRVRDLTLAQVRAARLDDGSRIPTLDDLLAQVARAHGHAVVEIKNYGWTAAAYRRVYASFRAHGISRVTVEAMRPGRVLRTRRALPAVRTALISWAAVTPAQVRTYGGVVLDAHVVTSAFLDRVQGLPVYVFNADDPAAWEVLAGRAVPMTDDAPAFQAWCSSK